MFTQARAIQGAAILYALARDHAERAPTLEWRAFWRNAQLTYELAAVAVCPGLGGPVATPVDDEQATLHGLGGSSSVIVRMGRVAAVVAATLSTACSLPVNGTEPVQDQEDAGYTYVQGDDAGSAYASALVSLEIDGSTKQEDQ
jgi:hypothetical protein